MAGFSIPSALIVWPVVVHGGEPRAEAVDRSGGDHLADGVVRLEGHARLVAAAGELRVEIQRARAPAGVDARRGTSSTQVVEGAVADGLFRVDCLLSDGRAVEADGQLLPEIL